MSTKKLHYFSGITLTIFIGFHLFNHFMGLWGPATHIAWMEWGRVVYRNILVESILLLAVVIQIVSGLKLWSKRRKLKGSFYQRVQLWSGFYLAMFLVIHVSAVIGGRLVLDLDTNYYFGVAGLNTFPFNLFFVPYYSLAIVAFFGHIASIHAQKMQHSIFGVSPIQQSHVFLLIGLLTTVLLLFSLTNGFTGIDLPPVYKVLINE